jgi:hypothetical protein
LSEENAGRFLYSYEFVSIRKTQTFYYASNKDRDFYGRADLTAVDGNVSEINGGSQQRFE